MITTLLIISIALIAWCFMLCRNRQPKYFVAKINEKWYICYEDLSQIDEVYQVAKFDTYKDAQVEFEKHYR